MCELGEVLSEEKDRAGHKGQERVNLRKWLTGGNRDMR